MRDLASCFSEHSIHVSDTSCSRYSTTTSSSSSCIPPAALLLPSTQTAVTSLYTTLLSSHKQFSISLTWSRTPLSHSLTLVFNDDPSAALKLTTNSRIFRKLKGSRAAEFHNAAVEIFWDLSTARYDSGPEPISGYYVFITIDSELGPILGDLAREACLKKLKFGAKTARSILISRQEHFSGNTVYSTRARFCESGPAHDIVIQYSGEREGLKYPVMSVCIDKKTVIRVKRLQWNFRGNQTVFLDGLLIDLMWDVHDWFNNPHNQGRAGPGYAVFMFRTRSGMESRLWLEEKMVQRGGDKTEFSLMIYACKNI